MGVAIEIGRAKKWGRKHSLQFYVPLTDVQRANPCELILDATISHTGLIFSFLSTTFIRVFAKKFLNIQLSSFTPVLG